MWSKKCLEDELEKALTRRKKITLSSEGLVTAAVLVPIFLKKGEPHILLTKRTDTVEHHKGEISFPGGKLDETDPDLLHCALRETAEEVGVPPDHVRVLGELDDFHTVATHFLVVPFVGVIPYPYEFTPNEREIAEVISVPLEVFFDASRRRIEIWEIWGEETEIVFYDWRGYTIWGATARILKHFTEIVAGSWNEFRDRCSAVNPQGVV